MKIYKKHTQKKTTHTLVNIIIDINLMKTFSNPFQITKFN